MAFHESLGQSGLLIVILFILFVLSLKKALAILKNALLIVGAAVAFPFAMNSMGFPVSADMESVLFFVTAGLGLYALYLLAKSVYALLGAAEKSANAASSPVKKFMGKKKTEKDEKD